MPGRRRRRRGGAQGSSGTTHERRRPERALRPDPQERDQRPLGVERPREVHVAHDGPVDLAGWDRRGAAPPPSGAARAPSRTCGSAGARRASRRSARARRSRARAPPRAAPSSTPSRARALRAAASQSLRARATSSACSSFRSRAANARGSAQGGGGPRAARGSATRRGLVGRVAHPLPLVDERGVDAADGGAQERDDVEERVVPVGLRDGLHQRLVGLGEVAEERAPRTAAARTRGRSRRRS